MSQKKVNIPPFPIVSSYVKLVMSVVLVAGVGVFVLIGIKHSEWVVPLVSSGGVCLIASLIALEPTRIASKFGVDKVAMAYFAGIVIRMGLSLAGASVLVYGYGMPPRVTGIFTAIWYVLLLAVEVMILVRFFNTAAVDPTRRPELMES
ncbi:hypothetical protein JD969_15375 [Planctomycetota bacterium]|nr:hypothetical protein JD969_15375 [Planctomycetota bacterium]